MPTAPTATTAASRAVALVALFSIVNWPCFRSSDYGQLTPAGSIFDHQMAYFSLDKNTPRNE
jgi:hypothetical protein